VDGKQRSVKWQSAAKPLDKVLDMTPMVIVDDIITKLIKKVFSQVEGSETRRGAGVVRCRKV